MTTNKTQQNKTKNTGGKAGFISDISWSYSHLAF